MNPFDTRTLSQNQRFYRIAIIGTISAIVLGFIYGFVNRLAGGWELSVLYIIIGYIVAYLVRRVGRGAQLRFKTLAAILTIVVILIGDFVYPVVIYSIPYSTMISFTLSNYLNGISGLLSLAFRAVAIYYAYNNAV